MKNLFFLALCLFPALAHADVLFLDLNFAPSEVAAVKLAAAQRGEVAHIFPARSDAQQQQINLLYREAQRNLEKYSACSKAGGDKSKCDPFMAKYEELSDQIGVIVNTLTKLNGPELEKILTQFKNSNTRLSAVVFSGHSGGTGMFVGLFGMLAMLDLTTAMKNVPGVLEAAPVIYLWGCYSGTLYSLELWQKNFPQAKLIAGYQERAPLGIRESSGTFLKSFMAKEEEILKASSPSAAHALLRSVNLFADLDGSAVTGGYFFTYDQMGSVDDMLKKCESFDENLVKKFECYEMGEAGCENPPADRQGPLRQLYSFLQVNRHCIPFLKGKYGPGIPSPDYLIRLIFLDNVKKNFESHHKSEFPNFTKLVSDTGFSQQIKLDGMVRSTRAQDLDFNNLFHREANRFGFRDLSFLDGNKWFGLLHSAVALETAFQILGPSWYRYASDFGHCVPFSWVEPSSDERDQCGLTQMISNLDSRVVKENVIDSFFQSRATRFFRESGADMYWPGLDLAGQRDSLLASFKNRLTNLEKPKNKSAIEERWIAKLRNTIQSIETMSDRDAVIFVISLFESVIQNATTEIEVAKKMENSGPAIRMINRNIETLKNEIRGLQKLIEN